MTHRRSVEDNVQGVPRSEESTGYNMRSGAYTTLESGTYKKYTLPNRSNIQSAIAEKLREGAHHYTRV